MSVYFGNKKVSPLIVQSKQQTNTEVQLALAGGNQDVIAPNGYLYYKVTIVKPDTLVSNNIRKGVIIAGVIGTMEEQKEEEEKTINITANNTYAVVPTEGKTLSKVTAVVTVSPTLQSKSVTPSAVQQIVTSDDGYQGLSQVIVYKAPTETIEITPTKEVQTKQPSGDTVGYSEVTVKPIPDNYIIPSGTLEITGNGTYDVTDKASAVVNVPTSSGTELNIHYGDTAPKDTSRLWIKSEKPSNISFPVVWKPEQIAEGITDTGATLSMKLSGIAAAAVSTKIYLFGGMKSGSIGDSVNTIQVFDATNNTIQTLSTTLPMKLGRSGVAAVGTKIYLFGGDSTRPSNLIQVFDTINNTIQTLPTTLSTTTYSIAAAAVGTKIYLFGGYFNNLDIIQVFDTTNNTIQTLSTTLPMKMYDIAAAAVGTKIYLFGGDSNSGSLDIIQVFDATNNTIQTLSTTLSMKLSGIAAAAVSTKIYLFGGFGGWYKDLIQVFDTINNTIQTLSTTLPMEMCFIAAAAVGTKIYLFGGVADGGRLNTIYQFTDEVPLASNDIIVTQKDYSLTFTLLKPPTEVELGCKNVYKGNQSLAKFIDAYVYDGVNWVNVNTNDVTFTKLYAPKISISGKTLTITNDGRNGSHVTNYKVYNGSTLLTTITATTLDLTTVITANGTYNISVIATGTGYTDSDNSNIVEYNYAVYNITTNLTGVTANTSNPTTVSTLASSTLTFTVNTGYNLPDNVTITGAEYTWTKSSGTLVLSNPTGNVSVTVAGVAISRTITATLTNVTAASGNATTIATGETKTLTYTAADGYVLPDTVTVTGATGVWNKDEGILVLSNPTANVNITITAVQLTQLTTPSISFVSGTTIQIDTIDDNATTIEVFADGLSIGEVTKS